MFLLGECMNSRNSDFAQNFSILFLTAKASYYGIGEPSLYRIIISNFRGIADSLWDVILLSLMFSLVFSKTRNFLELFFPTIFVHRDLGVIARGVFEVGIGS